MNSKKTPNFQKLGVILSDAKSVISSQKEQKKMICYLIS
jgi:hypothetical protein